MAFIVGIPAQIVDLQQKGLIERSFHDGLYPYLGYRSEAMWEEWPAHQGSEMFITRAGLIPPDARPATPGVDPTPQQIPFEQWSANLQPYNNAVDVDMPTSVVGSADLFLRSIQQLGLNAGQVVNRVARNELFKAYLSGQTCLIAACLTTDTTLRVAAINGFVDVIVPGTNIRPKPVNAAAPLQIKVGTTGGTVVTVNVVGAIPDNPEDPSGPGTLILSAAIGTAFASRAPVRSIYAPTIVRSSGGDSIDAIGENDTFTLQQAINAVAFLRDASVPPHEDGFYHAHLGSLTNAQVFADPVFQRLNTALPDGVQYSKGFIGTIAGVMFFANEESPSFNKVRAGSRSTSVGNAIYTSELGAEVVNASGIDIGRVIITGRGSIYERSLDEGQYLTEAGTTGKIGEFDVVNNGMQVLTEHIRMILRAPQDRLQQKVGVAWSISTSFPVPSDINAPSGAQRFKRAIVLEHALGKVS